MFHCKKLAFYLIIPLFFTSCNLDFKPAPPPKPLVVAVNSKRVQIQPNNAVLIPFTLATGEAPTTVTATSPELSSLTVSVDSNNRLLIRAQPNALPQGLIPVTVTLNSGETRRIAVEIGDFVMRQFNRFNAIRRMAGLDAVTFDDEASMNCWLNGRYRAYNDVSGHVENPSLPYATSEGASCAGSSNLSMPYIKSGISTTTSPVDRLFSAPFHAVGMLKNEQTSVGIGTFAQYAAKYPDYITIPTGVTSNGRRTAKVVTFPANEATTDLARYSGSEWPNPLTACQDAAFDPKTTGLPLIAMTGTWQETTVTSASLKVDGRTVPTCSYGSTQYVNTQDDSGSYPGGPASAQSIGRNILKGAGAVLLIPNEPLIPGNTYSASVTFNGQTISWNFNTALQMQAQSVTEIETKMQRMERGVW